MPDLLEDPENKDNWNYSVEFCGGTHIKHTNRAGRFVLVSEEGIAKVTFNMSLALQLLRVSPLNQQLFQQNFDEYGFASPESLKLAQLSWTL